MRVYCKYSGIEFQVENFAAAHIEAVHPVFYSTPRFLLSRAGDWAAGKLNEKERRLLFLALLNSTELVQFRCAAIPTDSTVQLNMETLIRFIGWQSAILSPHLILPRFVISPETKQLPNIRYWLEAWFAARSDFEEGYITTAQLAKLRNREAALEKLIKNATKNTEEYAGILGSWAMDAASVPLALHEYWKQLFKLKGIEIYQAKTVDLEELVEHLEENLEHGSIYAAAAMKHSRMLLAKNKSGLNFALGLPEQDFEKLTFEEIEKLEASPFRIVEDEVETYNKNIAIAAAPLNEPRPHDFSNRVEYLKAKARWNLAAKTRI